MAGDEGVREGVARGLIYATAMKFLPPSFAPVEPSLSVSLTGETMERVRCVGDFCRIQRPHARKLGRGCTAVRKLAWNLC
jgi:hypothetical protein